MDLTYLLFLQSEPGPHAHPRSAPEEEDDVDDEAVTVRNPTPERPQPLKPEPATPDANPIDPRVFGG